MRRIPAQQPPLDLPAVPHDVYVTCAVELVGAQGTRLTKWSPKVPWKVGRCVRNYLWYFSAPGAIFQVVLHVF